MTCDQIMQSLKAAGSEQTRKTYARHCITGDVYGVSYATLEKLRKTIKINQPLAEQLWKTGNHDARILAAMIANPDEMSQRLLDQWARSASNNVQAGALAKLAAKAPQASVCFLTWSNEADEKMTVAAWNILAELASAEPTFPDTFFERELKRIEAGIHSAPNMTRYSMNSALIAIGLRNATLQKKAISAAGRIGKVEVDHGETSCKTPDAIAYIEKASARSKKKSK